MDSALSSTDSGAERANRLLKRRADRYARLAALTAEEEQLECMLFDRGASRYVVRLEGLREVRVLRSFCPIPGARAVVPGIIYYRGEVLSLHDLAAFMDAPSHSEPRWIVVVEHGGSRMGLLADDIVEVRTFPVSDVRPAPLTLSARASCVEGVLADGGILLRAETLFSNPHFSNGL